MAVSFRYNTFTLMDAWRRRMRISPWHFNQATGAGLYAPTSVPGNAVWVQTEREGVAEGLMAALSLAFNELHFYHRPVYVKDRLQVTRNTALTNQLLYADHRHIQAIGKRGLTVIQAAAPIVYTDEDGDGVLETATITVATTLSDITEIQAFFQPATSDEAAGDERWQIEPLKVTANGVTAILRGHMSLFVDPAYWKFPYQAPNYNNQSITYATTNVLADFVTAIDVYRVYPDTTDAVRISCQYAGCCPDGNEFTVFGGKASIVNSEGGMLRISPTDCCSCANWMGVRYVDVWYLAGYPLDFRTGLPQSDLELALLKLANAEIPYTVPTNDARANIFYGDSQVYPERQMPPGLLNNPLGVKMGQAEAWRTIRSYLLPEVKPLGGGLFR